MIEGNSRPRDDGAGIHINNALTATIDNVTIQNNVLGNTYNTSFGSGLRVAFADYVEEATFVTVTNSVISGNSAEDDGGGFYAGAAYTYLTIRDSQVTNNYAGDDAAGGTNRFGATALIEQTTISGNTAIDAGGAMFSLANSDLTILRSTLSGNMAGSSGGAIDSTGTTISIQQSTISGNSAGTVGGGLYFANDPADPYVYTQTLQGSTVTNNYSYNYGGGVYAYFYSAPYIQGSIVSGNSDSMGFSNDFYDYDGQSTVNFTLIGDNGYSSLAESPGDANGNIIGGPVGGVVDAQLTALQDNGGVTLTHALMSGSPAIDRGDPALLPGTTTDQRGAERVFDGDAIPGARVDMGSVEYGSSIGVSPDFDGNGLLQCADIDLLTAETAAGTNNASFDLTGDGLVNGADITA